MAERMEMKLAVFDIDGTLTLPYDFEDSCYLEAVSSVFGFDDVRADWEGFTDVTDSGLVRELCERQWGRTPGRDELRRFRTAYSEDFLRRSGSGDGAEVPGAGAFVRRLSGRSDWCVAVATGNFGWLALHKLERGGFRWSEAPMATADDAFSRVSIVRQAVSRARESYGVEAFDHLVSVGDAPWDLRTARELEMPLVAVGERCGGSGASWIADYRDGATVLSRLEGAVCW